jgi:hypothetical protein
MAMKIVAAVASLVLAGLPTPSSAGPAELADIRANCLARTGLNGAQCDCYVQRATPLSGPQQAFVAATLSENSDRVAATMQALSNAELSEASEFFATAAPACL